MSSSRDEPSRWADRLFFLCFFLIGGGIFAATAYLVTQHPEIGEYVIVSGVVTFIVIYLGLIVVFNKLARHGGQNHAK